MAQITGRNDPEQGGQSDEEPKQSAQERLREALDKDQGAEPDAVAEDGEKPSIRERLNYVLNKPRERLEIEDEPQKDQGVEKDC
ncbi:MAG: molybdopterin-guanine dinucleotide biosynthesis protein MobA, partial [Roseobacter sp.]